MDKRNGANGRGKKHFNPDEIKVGDIITSDDILGIDREMADKLPPPGWLRGEASPFCLDRIFSHREMGAGCPTGSFPTSNTSIRIDKKTIFMSRIEELRENINEVRGRTIEILNDEILNSRDRIKEEGDAFLKEHPPADYAHFSSSLFPRMTDAEAHRIVGRIKFPKPEDLLDKTNLQLNFYDLTWEDFSNPDFLVELETKEVLSHGELEKIVEIRDAFSTKR
jgi:hypothetical protein